MEFNSKATCCVISKWAKILGVLSEQGWDWPWALLRSYAAEPHDQPQQSTEGREQAGGCLARAGVHVAQQRDSGELPGHLPLKVLLRGGRGRLSMRPPEARDGEVVRWQAWAQAH